MKRKKKHEDHVDEAWLLPYADVLTLLLALFIVLFAASEVDSKKFEQLSQSFNSELQGGTGVLENEAAVETFEDTSPMAKIGEKEPDKGSQEEVSRLQDQKDLGTLQEKIEAYIKEKGMDPKLQTEMTAKGLVLKIKEGVLYESGSADITKESRTVVEEISRLLVTDPPRDIFIEGHTDNVPTKSEEFPTNWELSSSRAINFMKIILENKDLDPKRFSATGYGEYQPIKSNKTAEGRAENRRVEVLISNYQQQEEN
ncbi:flagellar motor protein MotB [Planomicrobium sp. CPCC 101110]|uniref:flagellar motor protein MotB n=1 Tax=Planomicrobium sp. CPCC 101110 TaxID=2599619 RepID=UPI0011B84882|nr:flagellar motor protein MotB [Planomicrobium sp. CPCC 101110]TWT27813.1 flagellar motor protein MotB [Planomicrobium sp. CPCC 101110]